MTVEYIIYKIKGESNMRTIKNISILPVLVLFILIEILVTYNIQALPQQGNIINNRWYNSFYIDTTFNQDQSNSSICYGDSLFYVAWIEKKDNISNRIYVKRIVSDSVSIDSQPIDVTGRDSTMYYRIDNAYLDGYIFTIYSDTVSIVYGTGEDIAASIINTSNDSVKKIFIDYSYYEQWPNPPWLDYEYTVLHYPVVANDNEKFLIMYDYYHEEGDEFGTSSEGPFVIGKFYNRNGQLLKYLEIPCSSKSNPKSLIFDGDNYVLLLRYNDGTVLYITKIDTSGNTIKQDSISLYSSDTKLEVGTNAIASGNGKYLVVWSDYTGGSHCIIGRLYSEDLSIIDSSIFISQDQYVKIYPSIVFDGNNFIVTWQQYKWDSYNIKGAVVTPFGCVIDSFVVDNNEGDQVGTKLSYGNGHTLLTYKGWSSHFGTNKIMGIFNEQTAVGIEKRNRKEKYRIRCFVKYSDLNKVILRYSIEQSSYIKLKLFDLTGRNIKKLDIGNKDKGTYSIILDCSSLIRGVYFYNLEYDNNIYSGKINIVR